MGQKEAPKTKSSKTTFKEPYRSGDYYVTSSPVALSSSSESSTSTEYSTSSSIIESNTISVSIPSSRRETPELAAFQVQKIS
jgi:hypothetical protein